MPADRPATADWTILHGGALGDLCLTLRLALQIAGVAPHSRLQLVSRTDPGDLAAGRPAITRRSSEGIGLHWLHGEAGEPPPALAARFAGRRVINALAAPHSPIDARLRRLNPAAAYSFDPRARAGDSRHITEQWRGALADAGLAFAAAPVPLTTPDALRAAGRERLAAAGCPQPTLVVHPGSGGRAKCWPRPRFIEVLRAVRAAGVGVACVLGPAERERWPAAATAEFRGEADALLAEADPTALAGLLAAADAYLGNDAGPTHLAALLGAPLVALYGPTDPSVWGPLGPRVHVLAGDPAAGDDWGIPPGRVVAALHAALGRS